MQKRRNSSIPNALELRIFCRKPSIWLLYMDWT